MEELSEQVTLTLLAEEFPALYQCFQPLPVEFLQTALVKTVWNLKNHSVSAEEQAEPAVKAAPTLAVAAVTAQSVAEEEGVVVEEPEVRGAEEVTVMWQCGHGNILTW